MLQLVAVMALLVAPVVQGQGAIIGNGNVAVGVGESGALEVPYRGVPALGLPDEDPLFEDFLLRSQDGTRLLQQTMIVHLSVQQM